MNLNIFKNLKNNITKNNESVQEFLNELKTTVETNREGSIGILEKVEEENKVSIGTKNQMEEKMNEILKEYAIETIEKGDLYFIVERSKKDETYTTYMYNEEEDTVLKLLENELPKSSGVNSALRKIGEEYILDEEATLELENRINEMTEELLDEQNRVLEEYRKEGHLYRVSEKINNSVFLWDMTDEPKMEIEEVNFPENLLEEAEEGKVFEYINGEYRLKE